MLPIEKVVAVPDFIDWRDFPQIINMPVGPLTMLDVVGGSCFHSTGSEGAAAVDIKSLFSAEQTEPANLNFKRRIDLQNQGVGAGLGFHPIYKRSS